ncbi:MAG: ABC transporter ATP-binding protein [Limnochordaceae bacterium]|nr:ABC transporter ATP-binding protein [Limnochordaceae bacterium]
MIELRHLYKIFPPRTVAVRDVSLAVRDGEIHALVGENGAGKSTLMRILYGMLRPDGGEIRIDGRRVSFGSPTEAMAAGIGMVHQEFMLVPSLPVYENVVLGSEPVRRFGRIDWEAAKRRVDELARQLRAGIDLHQRVERLSVAAQQKVEILKILYRNARVLILDEPTAVLTPQETRELFERLREFRREGRTVVFISHKLDEVLAISDRISVMRQGRLVRTLDNQGVSARELAHLMVGGELAPFTRDSKAERRPQAGDHGRVVAGDGRRGGGPALEVRHVTLPGRGGRPALQDVSLAVWPGEIVGIAGVEGNGQAELVQVIVGLRRPQAGQVLVGGRDVTAHSIEQRRQSGLSFVPQDRKGAGAAPAGTLVENAALGHHRRERLTRWRGRLLDRRAMLELTVDILRKHRVAAAGPRAPFRSLSGGNQQKLILGRELAFDSPVLVLDQPTRGLDVASTHFVHETLQELRARAKAILVVSADLDELFALADRLLVMFGGQVVAELDPGVATREQAGEWMLGGRMPA